MDIPFFVATLFQPECARGESACRGIDKGMRRRARD